MSQIIDKIQADITGRRYMKDYVSHSLLSTNMTYEQPVHNPYLVEYFVGVKFGHTVRIEENDVSRREEAVKILQKAITEFIFGEFRSDLAKLQYQLYNRDFDEALKTTKDIEQRMFYS